MGADVLSEGPGAGAGAMEGAICRSDRREGAPLADGAVVGAAMLSEGPGAGAGAGAIWSRCLLEGAPEAAGAVVGAAMLSEGPGAGAGTGAMLICNKDRRDGALSADGAVMGAAADIEGPGAGAGAGPGPAACSRSRLASAVNAVTAKTRRATAALFMAPVRVKVG